MQQYIRGDIGRTGGYNHTYPSVNDLDFGAYQTLSNEMMKPRLRRRPFDRMTRGRGGNDLPLFDIKRTLTGRPSEYDVRLQGSNERIAQIDSHGLLQKR